MKNWFHAKFRALADEFNWRLEAWAVLSNHYHFIAHNADGSPNAESLGTMLKKLHSLTTKELNKREETPGRTRLWQNFRDTHLTYQPSYLARLHYVHENAVHHGLVRRGSDYPWCSARPFREAVTPAWVQTVYSFKYDQIAKGDDE